MQPIQQLSAGYLGTFTLLLLIQQFFFTETLTRKWLVHSEFSVLSECILIPLGFGKAVWNEWNVRELTSRGFLFHLIFLFIYWMCEDWRRCQSVKLQPCHLMFFMFLLSPQPPVQLQMWQLIWIAPTTQPSCHGAQPKEQPRIWWLSEERMATWLRVRLMSTSVIWQSCVVVRCMMSASQPSVTTAR